MGLRNGQGTITFTFQPATADWATDGRGEKSDPVSGPDGVSMSFAKYPDGTLAIAVEDVTEPDIGFAIRGAMPPNVERGVNLAVTWDRGLVTIYVNGQQIHSEQIPPAP